MARRDIKRAVLDAALAVFSEAGERQSTVGDICARAGVSNGALFHHFPNREAIEEALYVNGIVSYQAGLSELLDRRPTSAREAIAAAVRHHLQWTEGHRDLARFMYNRGRPEWGPVRSEEVSRLNRDLIARVRFWLAPLVRAGEIRSAPGVVIAASILGPAHFVCRRWVSGQIETKPTAFVDDLAETAWAALAPAPKAGGRRGRKPRAEKSNVEPLLASTAGLDGFRIAELIRTGRQPNLAALELIGARLIAVDRGRATIAFQPGAVHADVTGDVHYGLVACLLEAASAVAVSASLPPGQGFEPLQLNVLFQQALPLSGPSVLVQAALLQKGDRSVIVEATLTNEDGQVFARSSGTGAIIAAGRSKDIADAEQPLRPEGHGT